VVDDEGTSHVWDDQFVSDKDAHNTAIQAIEAEGAIAFMRGDNVISFRKNNASWGQNSAYPSARPSAKKDCSSLPLSVRELESRRPGSLKQINGS
jgi:hypothetical protein